jgi:hypothetical protein
MLVISTLRRQGRKNVKFEVYLSYKAEDPVSETQGAGK